MKTIEIDHDVYDYLQSIAVPFVDTPNDVLKRLLLNEKIMNTTVSNSTITDKSGKTKEEFVQGILKSLFDAKFHRARRYQWLFESADSIVYFQNFDKSDSPKLWYRINQNPLLNLLRTSKKAYICFTNPADKVAYLLPLEDINVRAKQVGWSRDYYEVNLDVLSNRWTELDWNIEAYKVFADSQ
jgi:predicted CopG family antitoxin